MARHMRLKHPKILRQFPLEKRNVTFAVTPKYKCWVRKYCTRVGDKNYRCNLCEKTLSLPNGSFGNMKRHIRTKHPYTYEQETGILYQEIEEIDAEASEAEEYLDECLGDVKKVGKSDKSDDIDIGEESGQEQEVESEVELESTENSSVGVLSETSPDFEEKIKYLCNKPIIGKQRALNPFWNFFEVLEKDHLYMCLTCNKQLAIYPHSSANLKRHIKIRHQKQYQIMMKYIRTKKSEEVEPISFDKYYFDSEADGKFKCKECSELLHVQDEDQTVLFEHIKVNHPDQILAYQEEEANAIYDSDVGVISKVGDVTEQ